MISKEEWVQILPELIDIYMNYLDNPSGGNLHIALSDGNLSDGDIWFCQEAAMKAGDRFGELIGELLRSIPEDEREAMYEIGWEKTMTTDQHNEPWPTKRRIKKLEADNVYLRDLLNRLMSEVRPYCRPSMVQYDVFPVFKEAVDHLSDVLRHKEVREVIARVMSENEQ